MQIANDYLVWWSTGGDDDDDDYDSKKWSWAQKKGGMSCKSCPIHPHTIFFVATMILLMVMIDVEIV